MPKVSRTDTRRKAAKRSPPVATSKLAQSSPTDQQPSPSQYTLVDFGDAQLLAGLSRGEQTGPEQDQHAAGPMSAGAGPVLGAIKWSKTDRELFLLVIDQLPLFGRTLVPIFGNRTLGRNEMIGVILSIVTGKIYDRKKISSYSQNLNGKVPPHVEAQLSGFPLVPLNAATFRLAPDILEAMGYSRNADLRWASLPDHPMPVVGHPGELARMAEVYRENVPRRKPKRKREKRAPTKKTPAGQGPTRRSMDEGDRSSVATTESKRSHSASSFMSLSRSADSSASTSGSSASSQLIVAASMSAQSDSCFFLAPTSPLDASSETHTASSATVDITPRRGSMPGMLDEQQGTSRKHPHLSLRHLLNS